MPTQPDVDLVPLALHQRGGGEPVQLGGLPDGQVVHHRVEDVGVEVRVHVDVEGEDAVDVGVAVGAALNRRHRLTGLMGVVCVIFMFKKKNFLARNVAS